MAMTSTAVNNEHAQRNSGFRLNKFSFTVKNFTPSGNSYPFEIKNDKVYVNLTSYEQRTAFFAELREKNVRARDTLYEYFVPASHTLNDVQVSFQTIVAYLKNLVDTTESLTPLKRCFKVLNDNDNFKVIVSAYPLAVILNTSRVFFPYRRNNGRYQRQDGQETQPVRRYQRQDGQETQPVRRYQRQNGQETQPVRRYQRQQDTNQVNVSDRVVYSSSVGPKSYAEATGAPRPVYPRYQRSNNSNYRGRSSYNRRGGQERVVVNSSQQAPTTGSETVTITAPVPAPAPAPAPVMPTTLTE